LDTQFIIGRWTFSEIIFLGEVGSSIEIINLVELLSTSNTEVAMRISSDIESGDTYFTDLNAFQMIERRRRLDKLPLQAHYYPMAGMAFIEDTGVRLSLVSGQPLGAASLHSGQIEVMQDRRLAQDDNRGLNQVPLYYLEYIKLLLIILYILVKRISKNKKIYFDFYIKLNSFRE